MLKCTCRELNVSRQLRATDGLLFHSAASPHFVHYASPVSLCDVKESETFISSVKYLFSNYFIYLHSLSTWRVTNLTRVFLPVSHCKGLAKT